MYSQDNEPGPMQKREQKGGIKSLPTSTLPASIRQESERICLEPIPGNKQSKDHIFFFFFCCLSTYLFLAVMGLCCCLRAFSSRAEPGRRLLPWAGFPLHWLLLLWGMGSGAQSFRGCSTWTQQLRPRAQEQPV